MKCRFVAVAITVVALIAPAALRANDERLKESAAVLTEMAGMAVGSPGTELEFAL